MKNTKSLLSTFVLATAVLLSTNGFAGKFKAKEKILSKRWKMYSVMVNGEKAKPEHEKMVIEFKKNGQFTITAVFEETHNGTWKLSDDKTKLILNDKTFDKERVLEIKELDETHLSLSNYDNDPNKVLSFIPISKGKAMHLNHKEYLLCKRWTVTKSDKEEHQGIHYVFNVNKSFVILPANSHTPISTGKWTMSADKKTIHLDIKDENVTEEMKQLDLEVETLHRHKLVLVNPKNGFKKELSDEKLSSKSTESSTSASTTK